MIDELESWLSVVTEHLAKLYTLPQVALTLLTCLVVGRIIKGIKRIPNECIPIVVIMWGMVCNMLIADPRADTLPIRLWLVKNGIVGMLIGFIAWAFHKLILKRLACKYPPLENIICGDDTVTVIRCPNCKMDFTLK